MTPKKFINLVYIAVRKDKINIYEACLAVKDHYEIEDEDYVNMIKQEKTLKTELMHCCIDLGLVKHKKKSKNIDSLF